LNAPVIPSSPTADHRDFFITPGGRLEGRIRVPGDKSISHRALLLGALAEGATRIANFLESADCLATLAALQQLGVNIESTPPNTVIVHGSGPTGLQTPAATINCSNSGTSMRLLTGMLAGQPFESVLTGDASLRRRPMLRVIEPLMRMGAGIESESGHAPIKVQGQRPLNPLRYEMPMASAQVKSSLLIAGLQAVGETWIKEPATTRDHTERILQSFGCTVLRDAGWLGIRGGSVLHAADIAVPGDLSSAAFFLIGAASSAGSHVVIESVGINPSRDGVLRILRSMGADIRVLRERMLGHEPVADVEVFGGTLQGVEIGAEMVALAIDELPALLVIAATAHGTTTLRGAAELRVKESDRLQAVTAGLRGLGVDVELWDDGMRVKGRSDFPGGQVNSFGDHRVAMAFAMAGLRTTGPLRIRDCRNVDTSFPGFAVMARNAGLPIEVEALSAV
jgi:3-phosphoshikimate 1-carboxyvinyltransferase